VRILAANATRAVLVAALLAAAAPTVADDCASRTEAFLAAYGKWFKAWDPKAQPPPDSSPQAKEFWRNQVRAYHTLMRVQLQEARTACVDNIKAIEILNKEERDLSDLEEALRHISPDCIGCW